MVGRLDLEPRTKVEGMLELGHPDDVQPAKTKSEGQELSGTEACGINRDLSSFFLLLSVGVIKECIVIFVAEFFGTAILLYCGCLCGMQFSSGIANPLAGPVGFGFTVTVIICIFGPISGAHINPSVTTCAIVYGLIPYWVSSFVVGITRLVKVAHEILNFTFTPVPHETPSQPPQS